MLLKRAVYRYVSIFLLMIVSMAGCGGFSTKTSTDPTLTPPPTDDKFGQEFQAIKSNLNVVTCSGVLPTGAPTQVVRRFSGGVTKVYAVISLGTEGTHILKAYCYRGSRLLLSSQFQLEGQKSLVFSIFNEAGPLSEGDYRIVIAYSKTKEDKGYFLSEAKFSVGMP